MSSFYNNAHEQFGIDEVYIHPGIDFNLIKKLEQRAELTLEGTDVIVKKNVSFEMVLIFNKRVPSRSLIYRFLEFLKKNPEKDKNFQESHTLLNQEEFYDAIKTKKFILVTSQCIPV